MELAEQIAQHAVSISPSDLPERVVHEVKRRFIDSLAVAYASRNSPPAKVVREVLPDFQGRGALLGGGTASYDMAAFFNTLLIRYLDFNDTYLSLEPLHPSDMIGGAIALGGRGEEVITAVALGYEVSTRLCDSTSLRKKGFDHVNFLQVGAAVMAGKLLRLNAEQMVNAISLSLIPHVALRETRSGSLSMWKAGATAEAVRNALFSAVLAKSGFTGPSRPFSGKMGFKNVVAPDLNEEALKKMGVSKILETYIKKYPVEYHAQAAVEAALQLEYTGNIKRIVVETYEAGKTILADEGKWDPKNKETADHSLPYIVSVSLLTKRMWLDSYDLIGDKMVTELMKKVNVVEREDYTKVYPKELPTRLIVETDRGTFEKEVRIPRGHYKNPMSDQEVEEKALQLGLPKGVIEKVWDLERMEEVSSIASW